MVVLIASFPVEYLLYFLADYLLIESVSVKLIMV